MRTRPKPPAEKGRIRTGEFASGPSLGCSGVFEIHKGKETLLLVIASENGGWDHVSVSLPHRCPTWAEMCYIRDLFFRDDEWVVQYSPAKAANINNHPYCLHWWRSQFVAFPHPPPSFVGIAGLEVRGV